MPTSRRRVAGALLGILLLGWWLLLPPAALPTPAWPPATPTAKGAYHIHSTRSDGSGSIDEIARAAGEAGLAFIIVTDHGDGTRAPDPPSYVNGVLVIDGVEISTSRGHYGVVGLPAAPYPLAGEAFDVIEDVRRLGGFGLLAHPDSPRVALAWQDFHLGFDALEWLNIDTSWRDESETRLARTVLTYLLRQPESLATLFKRPDGLLSRWDALGQTRNVPAIAAADAHARLGFRQNTDPDMSSVHVPLPAYRASFEAFSNHVILARALSGNAAEDAALVLAGIRQGRLFTVVDALATPGGIEFSVASGDRKAGMGQDVALNGDVIVNARVASPPGASIVVLRDGERVHEARGPDIEWNAGHVSGVYRVEVYLAGSRGNVPWVLTNPVYVGLPRETGASFDPPLPPIMARIPARTAEAAPEFGERDTSRLVPDTGTEPPETLVTEQPINWQYALAPGSPTGRFAAIQLPVAGGLAAFDRVRFRVTASRPMRLWVQVRARESEQRWGRTFYADGTPRIVDLPLRDFVAIGTASAIVPPLDRVDSVLFVADTVNTLPGSEGTVQFEDVAFVR